MTNKVKEIEKEIEELKEKLEKEDFEPLKKFYKAQIEYRESMKKIFSKW